jgi:hypothetical protein
MMSGIGGTLGNLANFGGSIYGLINSSNLQGTANSATSNIAAIQGQQLGYAKQLQDLMGNPSSVSSLPGYQFLMNQGTQAIDRSAAAPGGKGLGSGGEMTDLEQYGQGLADQFYNQQVSTLGELSGIPNSANALAEALRTSGAASTGTGSSIQGLLNSLFGSGSAGGLIGSAGGLVGSLGKLFSGDTTGGSSNLSGLDNLIGDTSNLGNLDLSLTGGATPSDVGGTGYSFDTGFNSSGFNSMDPSIAGGGGGDSSNLDLSSMFSGPSGAGGQAATPTAGQNIGSAMQTGGSLLGIGAGLARGSPAGYASAAVGSAGLAGRISGNARLSGAAGIGGSVLGLYQGLQSGGVAGDTEAGISAGKLATLGAAKAGLLSSGTAGLIGRGLGYAAAPLALYEFGKNWQSGNTGSDALSGAETGATIGSIGGPVFALIGGVIGGAVGAVSSAFGGGRNDPETLNWNQAVPQLSQNPALASQLSPSQGYQLLAGMMDAKNNSPGHSTNLELAFGRMGEGNLMTQMAGQINSAIGSGKLKQNSSPSQIYSQVVQPWLKAKGGYVNPGDIVSSNGTKAGGSVDAVLTQLIGQWQSGALNGTTQVGTSGQTIAGLPAFGA